MDSLISFSFYFSLLVAHLGCDGVTPSSPFPGSPGGGRGRDFRVREADGDDIRVAGAESNLAPTRDLYGQSNVIDNAGHQRYVVHA